MLQLEALAICREEIDVQKSSRNLHFTSPLQILRVYVCSHIVEALGYLKNYHEKIIPVYLKINCDSVFSDYEYVK